MGAIRLSGSFGAGIQSFGCLLYSCREASKSTHVVTCTSIVRSACALCASPCVWVFRGLSKCTLPGYVGCFQFLRTFRQQNACEQAPLIFQAAVDPLIARRAKRGECVRCWDHFGL